MNLNRLIDHTKLGPKVSKQQIDQLIEEAKKHNFKSICVDPIYVSYAKKALKGSTVLVCTVVGFPAGTHLKSVKVFETEQAIKDGADEIDMVINQNALINGDQDLVYEEIKAVKEACGNRVLKVIIETANLTDDQKEIACNLAVKAKADYVKTSTGFSGGGATIEDVKLMRQTVGSKLGVKASGGIGTYEKAKEMIDAGATRIGASKGVAIVQKTEEKKNDTDTTY
ncbi:MAG: deoxyribose-phosphate aldolase [Acholeplasmataceae bacterium]|jgi:deoxyribose-phosphate aldolase|nr:deoxyribose-phosphate aldolase [Acholeplasmataceae bacterium]